MERIGIIGSGNMGRAIGVRLAHLGYKVTFGARRLDQSQEAAEQAGHGAQSASNDETAASADILIWTMREANPRKVLADPDVLNGKIVIDLNNRDYANDVRSGAWFETAIAEELQANLPKAKIVKAWNTIAMEAFDTDPTLLLGSGAQTFIAGGDAEARAKVSEISSTLGFKAVELGDGVAAMRAAEALGDVIRLLMINGNRGARAHLTLTELPEQRLGTIGARQTSNYG